ncbi:MAG: PAS domain S-box protein [Elusimicrobia bacterium]|nr:PAS domain S-box protein [Elusimicrobiota bacterium]
MTDRSHERLMEQILECVGEAIHVLDMEGLVVYENAHAVNMFGGGMIGRRGHEIVHSRREDGTPCPIEQCPITLTLQDGRLRRVSDDFFWRQNGSGFPVDYTCAPLRGGEGAMTGAVVSFRDASAFRNASNVVRAHEDELRLLTRQLEKERACLIAAQAVAKIGSWETDLATLSAEWSEEAHRIFETDGAVFRPTHQAFLAMVHPEDRARVDEAFGDSLKDDSARVIEHRVLLPDGRIKTVEERWRVFADASGRFVKAVGTCQDITERKRTEGLLRESEEKFTQLFESSPAKIAIGDMFGRMVDVNEAYAEFLGYARREMAGRSLADLGILPPQELERLIQKGRGPGAAMRDVEVKMTARDGRPLQVLMSANILVLNGVQHRVATLVDITELRRAEEERRRLQEQALRAQRVESIGTLAGGIAHDLNNSLSPIMMSLQLLRMKLPDLDSKELIDTLEGCVQHAADMVQQVLTFSRGVEGRRIAVDPLVAAGDIRKIVRDTFPKTIEFELAAAPEVRSVLGDPTQFYQVLLNLCVNARDAMPAGGKITVTIDNVRLSVTDVERLGGGAPGDCVLLVVSDTGIGIPRENREKVFEPFFTTKGVGQGTGLGLSTTLAIVKSHGGAIALESEPGRGSRFLVYLPAAPLGPTARGSSAAELPCGRGERLLVVDDEVAIRNLLKRILESYDYRVMLAADGREAAALYAQHGPSIAAVLTDMAMPGMGGAALISALRAMNPALVILASSGHSSDVEKSQVLCDPSIRFLAKPYSTEALLKNIRSVLDAGGGAGEPRSVPT